MEDLDSWKNILKKLDIQGAKLITESDYDLGRRVYHYKGVIFKITNTQLETTSSLRVNTLKEEYDILKSCMSLSFVPNPVSYVNDLYFESLSMRMLKGELLINLVVDSKCSLLIITRIIIALWRLSLLGIAHNDLMPTNIMVDKNYEVSLFDFDQSINTNVLHALLLNYGGLNMGQVKVHGSFRQVLKHFIKQIIPAPIKRVLKAIFRPSKNQQFNQIEKAKLQTIPSFPETAPEALRCMEKAWHSGAKSDANAPQQYVAYYSLKFMGHSFPGERPWEQRWKNLRSITNYKSKRTLELGCNLGLLSSHLKTQEQAEACMAVDIDKAILEGAAHVAEAMDASISFAQINFDDLSDWESKLLAFKPDIVFALSVINWVKDKDRLYKFLSNFPEIIVESHETVELEIINLKASGFDGIKFLGMSERNRPLIHGTKY